jgi:hypothetical protein
MSVADAALPIHHEYRGSAQGEKLLALRVLCSYPAPLVGQDGVWSTVSQHIFFNHLRPIGHQYQDFRVQVGKLLIVMVQLRHVVGTVRSDEANIEHQQYVLPGVDV